MCGVLRCRLKRSDNHRFDPGVFDRARRTRSWVVMQAIHAAIKETPTPLADRLTIQPHLLCDRLVLPAFRARQNDAPPKRQGLRRLAARSKRGQLCPLRCRDLQSRKTAHRSLLSKDQETSDGIESILSRRTSDSGH